MATESVASDGIAIFVADEEIVGSRIVWVNDAFVKMSGYTEEQLVGHTAMLLAGARPDLQNLRRAVSAGKEGRPYGARERKVRPDGSSFDALVHIDIFLEAPRMILVQRALGPQAVHADAYTDEEPNHRGRRFRRERNSHNGSTYRRRRMSPPPSRG